MSKEMNTVLPRYPSKIPMSRSISSGVNPDTSSGTQTLPYFSQIFRYSHGVHRQSSAQSGGRKKERFGGMPEFRGVCMSAKRGRLDNPSCLR